MKEREELLLLDEQLRNADKDIDQSLRESLERGEPITRNRAGQLLFRVASLPRAGNQLDVMMNFLQCPAAKLTDKELKERIKMLEKGDGSAHYVASFLRVHKSGEWYDRSVDILRRISEKWKTSSVNRKKFKKSLNEPSC